MVTLGGGPVLGEGSEGEGLDTCTGLGVTWCVPGLEPAHSLPLEQAQQPCDPEFSGRRWHLQQDPRPRWECEECRVLGIGSLGTMQAQEGAPMGPEGWAEPSQQVGSRRRPPEWLQLRSALGQDGAG